MYSVSLYLKRRSADIFWDSKVQVYSSYFILECNSPHNADAGVCVTNLLKDSAEARLVSSLWTCSGCSLGSLV